MWATDEEYRELLRDIRAAVQARLANAPQKGRRRRMVFSVFTPGEERRATGKAGRAKAAGTPRPAARLQKS